MSEMTTFFRHCPSCGRRFEIRLLDRRLVKTERESHPETRAGHDGASLAAQRQPGPGHVMSPLPFRAAVSGTEPIELEERVVVTVVKKEFQYSYRCKHCGYAWSEMRFEESGPKVEK